LCVGCSRSPICGSYAEGVLKSCCWLQMAHASGFDAGKIIDQAHAQTGPHEPTRAKAQRGSLIRNRVILERLGCIDEAGMIKLRKGNAPTITQGPYAGEIVNGDHIIPRSVCPELDNTLYNLEMMRVLSSNRDIPTGVRYGLPW
jgi:hypothetical protein